ncbi:MAG: RagB/SusD family nutrient uptake outer membrane protein [Bacteroidales bacterium]|nr:RagB/SusD family nutrient uptake outer membrane protein [Bacteroidales bacterium]
MKKIIIFLTVAASALFAGCTNLDEIYYSEISQNIYFQTKDNVYAALARPYTKWRGTHEFSPWMLQEIVTDEFCVTQKGTDYESGGVYRQLHWHTWDPDHIHVYNTYFQMGEGISYALAMIKELSNVDYVALGLTEKDRQDHILQLRVLVAYSYLRALDYFGGMPIYKEFTMNEVPRSTAKETFDYVEGILLEAISESSSLPKKKKGDLQTGWVDQGIAATCLMRLYFNAQVYIGEPRFDECAKLCQDIMDGKYGYYALEETWNAPFGFENEKSCESIWLCASQYAKNQISWDYERFNHYGAATYYDIDGSGGSNGAHLQPSLAPDGTQYDFNIGRPFSRFNDQDLRKRGYVYNGNKQYEGMFLFGKQERITSDGRKVSCIGAREYMGEVITFVDQVAQFKKLGKEYNSASELPSNITTGEENSGVRLVKRPIPNMSDRTLKYNPDYVIMRYAEVLYTLAECKYRSGDKQGAADLINSVRKRNFAGGMDPDPLTVENLNKYRFLQEWMTEFLSEHRRRTDLRRWNAYTNEEWWDHKVSDHHRELFPIPQKTISASNAELKQNPGYGGNEMSPEDAGLFYVPDVE